MNYKLYVKPVVVVEEIDPCELLAVSHEETVEFYFNVSTDDEWEDDRDLYLE